MIEFTGKKAMAGGGERVAFEAFDGKARVVCAVSREALEDHAGVGIAPLDAFDLIGGRIEAAASQKYEAGCLESDGSILVKTADL
jgi:hypothetical protein